MNKVWIIEVLYITKKETVLNNVGPNTRNKEVGMSYYLSLELDVVL